MTVYREKEVIFDCLKRSLDIRHSPIIYTSYKYIRVLFSIVLKGMFRQFHTGCRIYDIPADLTIANLVDIRMPCLQGNVMRKVHI